MRRSDKFKNPFYGLLILTGVAFAVTAAAYGVMATREAAANRPAADGPMPAEHPLMTWMRAHGNTALVVELVCLGICTVGAIGTDDYWQRRTAAAKKSEQSTMDQF